MEPNPEISTSVAPEATQPLRRELRSWGRDLVIALSLAIEIIYQARGGIAGRHGRDSRWKRVRQRQAFIRALHSAGIGGFGKPGSHPHPRRRIFRHGRSSDQLE